MKRTFSGLFVSGFIWFFFISGINLFKMLGQCAGYKAILIFLAAIIALFASVSTMRQLGEDMEIADMARKLSKEEEAKKNGLPKV